MKKDKLTRLQRENSDILRFEDKVNIVLDEKMFAGIADKLKI